ncbi:aminoglycoside phosphotransferase family protein [Chloroflexi bacterium TSY]|nr:aminoglycoside phosphotransferase family protein [Chloroflexi bacterium TSY]
MENQHTQHVQKWLIDALAHDHIKLIAAHNLKHTIGREVWDATIEIKKKRQSVIVSIFKRCSLDFVNTNLPPAQTMLKSALAVTELATLGIPTPRLFGYRVEKEEAAIVYEKALTVSWEPFVRIKAAQILARLHTIDESHLSQQLRELLQLSDPRESRTTGGLAPQSGLRTLVHGDYFSKNILPTSDGLCVIDWETFDWGDPMWDLGFLIGADPNLGQEEVEAVISTYVVVAPLHRECLDWHKARWDKSWRRRKSTESQA